MVKENVMVDGKPVKVEREDGYLYFVNSDGMVMRAKMQLGKRLSDDEIKKRKAAKEKKTKDFLERVAANKKKMEQRRKDAKERKQARLVAKKKKLESALAKIDA